MKTFKDLEFKPSHYASKRAYLVFPNNYGISVIQGIGSYTSNDSEYEAAIMLNGSLCYSTPITNDVIGHQSEAEISEIMKKIQELPLA
jgi:hypothetical protein